MIYLSDIQFASGHVRERAKNMWFRRSGPDSWRVVPKDAEKVKRLVRFYRSGGRWVASCTDLVTGKPCEANYYKTLCGHVYCIFRHLEQRQRREQEAAA